MCEKPIEAISLSELAAYVHKKSEDKIRELESQNKDFRQALEHIKEIAYENSHGNNRPMKRILVTIKRVL